MSLETKVIKSRLGLLGLVEELGNVCRTFKYLGYSRDTFYRYKELFKEGAKDALKDMNRRVANIKNRTEPHIEERVVSFAIEHPAFDPNRASNELKKEGVFLSPCSVRWVWIPHDLETFQKRLKALEAKVAGESLILLSLNSGVISGIEYLLILIISKVYAGLSILPIRWKAIIVSLGKLPKIKEFSQMIQY